MAGVAFEIDEHLFALCNIAFGQNKAPHGPALLAASRNRQ
jgi:hypothetical protein